MPALTPVRLVLIHGLLALACLIGPLRPAMAESAVPVPLNENVSCATDRLHYCHAGSGEPTLLFLHGWGGRAEFWNSQINDFSSRYRVYAVDLPGHARSGYDGGTPTIKGLAEALAGFLNAQDLSHVILIGHDMGGFVGLALTQTDAGRARIRGLVAIESLVDTRMSIPARQYQRVVSNLRRHYRETARQLTVDLFPPTADAALVNWVAESVATTDPDMSVALLDDVVNLDLLPLLSQFEGPVRILNTVSNPPRLDSLRQAHPRTDAVVVPWESHFSFLEHPDQFNQVLLEVLQSLAGEAR
ncbi:MAG: alpha/beta hydrolase [Candidatus Thiodiazotropha sp.]